MRRPLIVLAALVAMLALPAPANAKSFTLPEARIEARVAPDGSIRVTEHVTYSFSGDFSGGYREIPHLRTDLDGDMHRLSVTDISVSENGRDYQPGASAELGSFGAPDTFGVAELGDRTRIVWHYDAFNEGRTFAVRYTLRGLAVAYDDVVDVNLRVWGDEWEQDLSILSAEMRLPGGAPGETLVWGHPGDISGVTALKANGRGATLSAANVPAGRWVEMRVVFPRDLLDSTSGAELASGDGLQEIAEEEDELARQEAADRRRLEWLKQSLPWLLPLGIVAAALPALLIAF